MPKQMNATKTGYIQSDSMSMVPDPSSNLLNTGILNHIFGYIFLL